MRIVGFFILTSPAQDLPGRFNMGTRYEFWCVGAYEIALQRTKLVVLVTESDVWAKAS